MKNVLLFAWFALVWVALWGDLSWANVLGGIAVGALVVLATDLTVPPSDRDESTNSHESMSLGQRLGSQRNEAHRLRPVAALAYLGRFLLDLTLASIEVSKQVFWPIDRLRPGVVRVILDSRDTTVLTLVANTITLTPGTMTLEIDPGSGSLWVHALHLPEGEDGSVDTSSVTDSALVYERHARATLGLGSPSAASATGESR